MTTFTILISLTIAVNILGATLYLGSPGLQYIVTPLVVLIASIFTFIALYSKRKSNFYFNISGLILAINIITGTPYWLQNAWASGSEMRMAGLVCYGVGVPLQIILFIISLKRKKTIQEK